MTITSLLQPAPGSSYLQESTPQQCSAVFCFSHRNEATFNRHFKENCTGCFRRRQPRMLVQNSKCFFWENISAVLLQSRAQESRQHNYFKSYYSTMKAMHKSPNSGLKLKDTDLQQLKMQHDIRKTINTSQIIESCSYFLYLQLKCSILSQLSRTLLQIISSRNHIIYLLLPGESEYSRGHYFPIFKSTFSLIYCIHF